MIVGGGGGGGRPGVVKGDGVVIAPNDRPWIQCHLNPSLPPVSYP